MWFRLATVLAQKYQPYWDLDQKSGFGRTQPLGPSGSAVPYTEIVLQPGLRPALYATYACIKQGSIDYALK